MTKSTPVRKAARKSPTNAKKARSPAKNPLAAQAVSVAGSKPGPRRGATAKPSPEPVASSATMLNGANKTTLIADLIKRSGGASLVDLVAATGWQPHSVRGVISGVLRKKLGLAIELHAGSDGSQVYRLDA